jgi:hypothetical protein
VYVLDTGIVIDLEDYVPSASFASDFTGEQNHGDYVNATTLDSRSVTGIQGTTGNSGNSGSSLVDPSRFPVTALSLRWVLHHLTTNLAPKKVE